ncbi:hypothetical protein DFH09DRAFT_1278646 [Mycena vulgaris]|nr:hypothetical protein DFH09DRAFT_1278646 [Mycena vulgaris]
MKDGIAVYLLDPPPNLKSGSVALAARMACCYLVPIRPSHSWRHILRPATVGWLTRNLRHLALRLRKFELGITVFDGLMDSDNLNVTTNRKCQDAVNRATLDPRVPIVSCDDIDSRRLCNIIWGCLTTIFACTWVSIHPNVPPPNQGWLVLLRRRLGMMLVAVIAPELMGGHPITTMKQLDGPIGKQYQEAICAVKADYIMGRGKSDPLAKGVALTQGLWFITQYLARIHQHLPVTKLEVATLTFAAVNVFIWVIWWQKSLDVEQPIQIGPVEEGPEPDSTTQHLGLWDRYGGAVTGDYSDPDYNPMVSTSVPSFWSTDGGFDDYTARYAFTVECFIGSIFGAIHCAAWSAVFPTVDEMWMWIACSLMVTATPVLLAALFILYMTTENDVIYIISLAVFIGAIPSYTIARFFLIILPFTTLRSLPPDTFTDVNWSIYIPHL